jgi:hypothetical protein
MFKRYQSTSQDTMSIADKTAVVYTVILDETHPKYKDPGDIGSITFRMLSSIDPSHTIKHTQLPVAQPFEKNFTNLPLRNELVEITKVDSGFFYRRIKSDVAGNKNISGAFDTISKKFGGIDNDTKENSEGDNLAQYQRTENTQIARSNSDGVAELLVLPGSSYTVPSGKEIPKHVHYRELDTRLGMMGALNTVYY